MDRSFQKGRELGLQDPSCRQKGNWDPEKGRSLSKASQSSRAEQGGESDIKARQDFTRGYMSSSLAWVCGFRPENTRVCLSILFSISLSEDSPRNSEKAVDQRARGLNPAPATCLSCARHIIGKLRLRKGQWRAQGHKAPKYMRSWHPFPRASCENWI
ncbi:uncharacterized protein LOC110195572 [Phascolarctos cinereus]